MLEDNLIFQQDLDTLLSRLDPWELFVFAAMANRSEETTLKALAKQLGISKSQIYEIRKHIKRKWEEVVSEL